MSFTTGRTSFLRFRGAPSITLFYDTYLDRLRDHQAGRQRLACTDGTEWGWAAGTSVLDTTFDLAKNVYPEHLAFDFRVDTDKLPGDLLKAYYEVELAALAKGNPSGFASAKNKRDAKESARERLEDEAKDGRYRKRKCIPVLWDGRSGEVLFGATAVSQVERFTALFKETFGVELETVTAGRLAAEADNRTGSDADMTLATFIPGATPDEAAWLSGAGDLSFLGNEFVLWLWHYADTTGDTLTLSDGSDVTIMLARQLVLDCPRGVSGTDGFRSEGPTRLPEARRAIQAGKLPRKAGLTLVRHDQQYEFALHAESFGVGSAKLPAPPEDVTESRAKTISRFEAVREMVATLDLLYARFLGVRLSADWSAALGRMQRWLEREEAVAA